MLRWSTSSRRNGKARGPRAVLLAFLVVWAAPAWAQGEAILSQRDIFHPVYGRHGMVATQEATATRIGLDILRQGGNAVDAAVAVGFALAVTLPRAGNLGGGGFMLVHDARSGETVAIDYREAAPAEAGPDMYLDAQGNVVASESRTGDRASGVPGPGAGLTLAPARYGTLPHAPGLAPAPRLGAAGVAAT